jgi:hypothetical protein
MQGVTSSFPVVWTPEGSVIIRGIAAPAFAERKYPARIFTGPFFPSAGRASHEAVEAWLEIANIMAAQTASFDQSASSSKLSVSSAHLASRTKFTRENVTVHMRMFHKKALDFALHSHRDYEHAAALDGALALTEAFFACKGNSSAADILRCFGRLYSCSWFFHIALDTRAPHHPSDAIDSLQQPCDVEVKVFKEYAANYGSPLYWFHRFCPLRPLPPGDLKCGFL